MSYVIPKFLTSRKHFSPYNEMIAPLIGIQGVALSLFTEFLENKEKELRDRIYFKWNQDHTAIIDAFALKGYKEAGGKIKDLTEYSIEEAINL